MTKLNSTTIKRFVDEDTLDLSLNDIEELPIKEIISVPKITVLDLSCNLLNTLPEEFGSLVRLTRIDLSKNRLTSLPSSFGQLVGLQQLDLRSNQLHTLPPSFGQLKKLKWLDLKDNPLEEELAQQSGHCLNEKECQRCATNVTQYMRTVASCLERERQVRLKAQREADALKKKEEADRKLEEKEAKKAEKDTRRKIFEERKALERAQAKLNATPGGDDEDEEEEEEEQESGGGLMGIFARVFLFVSLTLVMLTGVMLACDLHPAVKQQSFCPVLTKSLPPALRPHYSNLREHVQTFLRK